MLSSLVVIILISVGPPPFVSAKNLKRVTAKIEGETYLGIAGRKLSISLSNKVCSIESVGDNGTEEELPKSFKIILNCGAKTQTLWDISKAAADDFSFDDPQFALLWAGDADGDGEIDLEMEMSPKYSCSKKVTFLSSKARTNPLVGVQGSAKTICGS